MVFKQAFLVSLEYLPVGRKGEPMEFNKLFEAIMEIPKFLSEMSQQMREQDNRITASPIWMVCYDKARVTAEGYEEYIEYAVFDEDYIVVYSTEDGSLADNDSAKEYLQEYHPAWCHKWCEENESDFDSFVFEDEVYDLPEEINTYHMVREREIVKACLTEADANWFIKRKQHDYAKLYTYVISMCYCPQMIELREWILSLTEVKNA